MKINGLIITDNFLFYFLTNRPCLAHLCVLAHLCAQGITRNENEPRITRIVRIKRINPKRKRLMFFFRVIRTIRG